MYIIIGGGGQVGYYLAKGLLDQGHEALLMDKNGARVRQLEEQLGANVVKGDACEVRVLNEYGCERADIVIAVTGDDEDNLVICQVAKQRFHVKRTIARVNNPANSQLFAQLGIDTTVSPTDTIMHLIESELPQHYTLVPLLQLTRAGLRLVELTVPADSPVAGMPLRELRLPRECNIVLIDRNGDGITPDGETTIQPEDRLYALVKGGGEAAMQHIILPEHTESVR
ncbi:MAG TPA: NAD-binding protein [Ktedonobacterales bacterium]|jgi:trk system potassium uptake protein TrkA